MKRSDFKIGFSKFTYMILHTTKQRTPVPTGVLSDCRQRPRHSAEDFSLKEAKSQYFQDF